jgi:hypothetical protein
LETELNYGMAVQSYDIKSSNIYDVTQPKITYSYSADGYDYHKIHNNDTTDTLISLKQWYYNFKSK